ncbi:MAG: helix-turn-helix transcriptional regulator [Acidimicrobiales bacterium]
MPDESDLEPTPPSERRICAAIRSFREAAGLTQAEVAERVGAPQSYLSRWETSRVPSYGDLWTIEVKGLGVAPGSVLRLAGFVDQVAGETNGVRDAISDDPSLSLPQKRMLLAAYEAGFE